MGARGTKSSSVALPLTYEPVVDESGLQVFAGRGNLYGFSMENNDNTSDIFVSFYDSAAAPTVGTDAAFEFRIPAGGNFGRDPQEISYRFFGEGCWVAATSTRGGVAAPATDASGQFWYKNS